MSPPGLLSARPADVALDLYLVATGCLWLLLGQPGAALAHGGLLLGLSAARRWSWAAWLPYLLLPVLCKETGWLNSRLHAGPYDDLVMRWEEALFGTSPALWLSQVWPSYWLSELLHLSYMLWWVMLPLVGVPLFLGGCRAHFDSLLGTSMRGFLLCYVCFIAFPVLGPRTLWDPVDPALQGPVYRACHAVVGRGAAEGAAFPSAHVTLAALWMLWTWRYRRALFPVVAPASAGAILCTVYGRFHYVVDGLAGLAMAALVWRWLRVPPR